ncbi:MAG: FtsX-like permease family protein [Candidatus Thorarchaeota archaeon]|nr:FtsX-like permease family protein [Candidatus Thorarchaeota archaeon]
MGLQKHSNLARYALGNVLKYRTKSTAIIIALVFSSTILCSAEFIREGLITDITASLEEGPDLIVQKLIGGRQTTVPNQWKDNVSQTTGVNLATTRVWGYTDVGSGALFTIMGVNATEYGSVIGATGTDILENGRFLGQQDIGKIVIGKGIVDMMTASAARITIEVGSLLSLISYNGSLIEFEIIGIFNTDSNIFSYDMILTDQNSARRLLGVDNSSCTDIAVWANQGAYLSDVAFRLDTTIAEARVLTRDAISDTMQKTYGERAGVIALLWAVMLATVVLLAFTISSAGSDETRREVGLLKALGFDTVDILEVRMIESVVLGTLGASLGISFAIIFDFVLGAPILSGFLLGWNVQIMNAGLPLAISIPTIFVVYSVAIIPILVASVVPAWKNAITEPDVVLRGI